MLTKYEIEIVETEASEQQQGQDASQETQTVSSLFKS